MSVNSPPQVIRQTHIRQAPTIDSPVGVDERRGTAHADRPFARRLFERQRLPTQGERVHKPVPRKRKRGNNNSASKKKPKKGGRRKKRTRRRRSRRRRSRKRRGRGIGASKKEEKKEEVEDKYDNILKESEERVAMMKTFMASASPNDVKKMEDLRAEGNRKDVEAAYDFMIKWCKENLTNAGGGRRTRRKNRRKKRTRRRRSRKRRGGDGWVTVSETTTEAEEEAQVVEGEHWSKLHIRRERRGREQAKLLTNELSGKLVRITIYGRPGWDSMDRQVVGTIKEAKVYISTTDIFLWFDGDSTWSGSYAEPDEVTILTQPGPTMDHFGDMVTHPTAIVPLPVKIEVKKPPKSAMKK